MSFTVFLGNLPTWVTADDIKGWLTAENLVADAIKVIRNPETQESKGFAFIEAPNAEEMNSIIRRFDRAPLEDRLLRANPAQPPKPKGLVLRPGASGSGVPSGPGGPGGAHGGAPHISSHGVTHGITHAATTVPSPALQGPSQSAPPATVSQAPQGIDQRPPRRAKKAGPKRGSNGGGPQSAFAEELAKAL
jgi:RNA recognition motif-containing protein